MNKGGKGLILLFVVAFVLWRLAFLAWSQYIYDEEEAKTGSISVIVMKGPMLPLLEHQPGDYEGGTLLFGLLAIPFMMLFGKPYLGLKMMALSTSLIMALVSVVWIRKLAGGAAAVFAGVLWLFAVPYLLQVGMIPWGNYAETAMLTVVTFYLLHTILFEGKNGWWRFALLGFFFGLGTWMHYGYIVTVLVCLVFMYLSRARLFLSSRFAVTILSAVIGFMPWVIYNVTHHFWGMARFADGVRPEIPTWKIIRVVKRAMSLFVDDLPCSLHLVVGGITTTKILSYIFYLVVVGLMVYYIAGNRKNIFFAVKSLWPAWQNQARGEALAVLVPFGYFLAYAFVYSYSEYGLFSSDWAGRDPESHAHIYVMLPPMIWISAIAAGRIYEKSKAAAIVPVVLLSLLGFVGQVQMLDFTQSQLWRLSSDFEGEKAVIYMEIGSKWGRSHSEIDKIAGRLGDPEKRSFYFGAGIKYGLDHVDSFQVAIDKCRALEDRFLPYCYFGLGTGVVSTQRLDVPALDALIGKAPESVAPYVLAGSAVGAIWFGQLNHPYLKKVKEIEFPEIVDEKERKALDTFIHGHLRMVEFRPAKQ